MLAVKLTLAEGGSAASGTLVPPLGLALDQGVVLSIDEDVFLPPLRFSTCLPQGCLVPLTFDQDAITAMRPGTALEAKAAANGSGQEVNFSISLSGFTSALNRIDELATSSPWPSPYGGGAGADWSIFSSAVWQPTRSWSLRGR